MSMYSYTSFKEDEIEPNLNMSLTESFCNKFNNFFCHFLETPNGYRKSQYNELDIPGILKYPDLTNNIETRIKVNHFQFYKDLDETVVECGTTNLKIIELILSWKKSKGNIEPLFNTLASIYKGMRNKGYLKIHLWT